MRVLKENGKRRLVEEYGPYFDKRYAIYEKEGDVHCFHTHDLDLAEEQWERTKDAETWAEHREKRRKELLERIKVNPELNELPFI